MKLNGGSVTVLDKFMGRVGSGRVMGHDYSYFVGWIRLCQRQWTHSQPELLD